MIFVHQHSGMIYKNHGDDHHLNSRRFMRYLINPIYFIYISLNYHILLRRTCPLTLHLSFNLFDKFSRSVTVKTEFKFSEQWGIGLLYQLCWYLLFSIEITHAWRFAFPILLSLFLIKMERRHRSTYEMEWKNEIQLRPKKIKKKSPINIF